MDGVAKDEGLLDAIDVGLYVNLKGKSFRGSRLVARAVREMTELNSGGGLLDPGADRGASASHCD